ncbi:hypothetical protein ACWDO0_27890 [Nocardia rhamnosiphila]
MTDFDDIVRQERAKLTAQQQNKRPNLRDQVAAEVHREIRNAAAQSFTALADAGAEVFTVVNESNLDKPISFPGVILEEAFDDGPVVTIVGRAGELADSTTGIRIRRKARFFGGTKDVRSAGRRVLEATPRSACQVTAWIAAEEDGTGRGHGHELVSLYPPGGDPVLPWRLEFSTTMVETYDQAQQQLIEEVIRTFGRLTAARLHRLHSRETN